MSKSKGHKINKNISVEAKQLFSILLWNAVAQLLLLQLLRMIRDAPALIPIHANPAEVSLPLNHAKGSFDPHDLQCYTKFFPFTRPHAW